MRLLYTTSDGRLRSETFTSDNVPQYAILSHTWKEGQEVTFTDLKELDSTGSPDVQDREGFQKICFCAQQAKRDGLEYFWVDTCCIDKRNNTELSEAINSMFRWYHNAKKCYVFLSDVENDNLQQDGERAFRQSKWFTRGWTLQELLAPRSVEFFSRHGALLGDKKTLKRIIHEITRIPVEALSENNLSKFDVTERFSWAANRRTTKEEDGAYCLFGIFGVHLPLIYGEGKEKALKRLKKEIEEDVGGTFKDSTNCQNREERLSEICRWLSAPDPSENYQKALKQRQNETGLWLLESTEFTNWKKNAASRLWLHGIPGCGKTILSTTVIGHVLQHCGNDPSMVTGYFYFDFKDVLKQDPELMLGSLLHQFLQHSISIPKCVDALFSSCENGNRRPSLQALLEVFKQTVQTFTHVYVILDALDECTRRLELLLVLETLAGWSLNNLHLLITSREERNIEISLKSYIKKEEIICLQNHVVDQDIQRYVQQRLHDDRSLSKWSKDAAISREIEYALMRGACGMFRWAACQMDMLAKCRNLTMLRKSLATLPQTLDHTYDRILSAISEADCVYAMRILRWLTFSRRPLTAEEIAEVVAIDIAREIVFDRDEVLIDPLEALDICSSLVTITTNKVDGKYKPPIQIITLAHYSVHEYLVSDRIRQGSARQYSMQESECHKMIAEGCLKYFLQLEHPISGIDPATSKLAMYTAEYWSSHLQNAGNRAEPLNRLAMTLLDEEEPAYLSWIRLYDPEEPWEQSDLQRHPDWLPLPLFYAATLGLVEVVKMLLDKGAELNEMSVFSGTALYAASIEGHEQIAKLLLDRGAAVDAESPIDGTTPLQAASLEGHEQIVKLLLDRGAEIDTWSDPYGTALQAASIEGHERVVKILLDKGADVNVQGGNYGTPLQAASARGHEQIVQILLDNGAKVNAQSGSYGTALQAASAKGYEQIAKVLISRGAEVEAQAGEYDTALNAALVEGHMRIIETLLNNGAGSSAHINDSKALELASAKGYTQVVKILLENGTEVNTWSPFYGNALHAAAYHGKNVVLRLLLSNYDTRKLQDPYGRSLLWWAAAGGHASTVQVLMGEYKLDPQIPDKFGRTPFKIAKQKRNIAVLDMISTDGSASSLAQAVRPTDDSKVWPWIRECFICTSIVYEELLFRFGPYFPSKDSFITCENCKTLTGFPTDEGQSSHRFEISDFW